MFWSWATLAGAHPARPPGPPHLHRSHAHELGRLARRLGLGDRRLPLRVELVERRVGALLRQQRQVVDVALAAARGGHDSACK